MTGRSLRRWIISGVVQMTPPTRAYALRQILWRFAGVYMASGSRAVASAKFMGNGDIIIGENTFIGHEVLMVAAAKSIKIGDAVAIAPRVTIVNGTHEIDREGKRTAGKGYSLDIVIDDGAWVGAGVTIIAGGSVGKKSVIGAGSVVTKPVPQFCIAYGNPCQKQKEL